MSEQANHNPRFKKKNSSNNTFRKRQNAKKESDEGLTRLNKHVANAGICSRRDTQHQSDCPSSRHNVFQGSRSRLDTGRQMLRC